MKQMSMKIVILMAVCLHLSACGKSKNDGSVQAPPTTEAPTLPDQSDKAGEQTSDEAVPTLGSEKEFDAKEEGNSKTDDVPTSPDKKIHTKIRSVPGHSEKGSTTPSVDLKPVKASGSDSDYAAAVEKMRQQANQFSGSADDELRSYLIAQEQNLSIKKQYDNLIAAQKIQSAVLKIDFNNTGDIALSLNIASGKDKKTILMGGLMRQDRTAKLRSSSGLRADLKCMDVLDSRKTCETALVSMPLESGDIKIIFRRTNMEIKADFGRKQCLTQECEDVYSMFRQSDKAIGIVDVKTIKIAKLESFEVINGKSSFRGIIRTRGTTSGREIEAVVIAGDLLNPELTPVMNIVADRTMNLADLVDLRNLNIHSNFHRAMRVVKITGNNGQGLIRMNVTMRALENGAADSFDLSFRRISTDLTPIITEVGPSVP